MRLALSQHLSTSESQRNLTEPIRKSKTTHCCVRVFHWFGKVPKILKDMLGRLSKAYATFLTRWPSIVLLVSGALSIVFTCISTYHFVTYGSWRTWDNPKEGFEARGTNRAGRLQAAILLRQNFFNERYSTGIQLYRQLPPPVPQLWNAKFGHGRASGTENVGLPPIPDEGDGNLTTKARRKREIAEDDHSRVKRSPLEDINPDQAKAFMRDYVCQQNDDMCSNLRPLAVYGDLLEDTKLNIKTKLNSGMDRFSKVVVSVPSLKHLMQLRNLKAICEIDTALDDVIKTIRAYAPEMTCFHHSWSIANYASCFSGVNNCSQLTQAHADKYHAKLKECAPHLPKLLSCRLYDNCTKATTIPADCRAELIADVFFRLLPKNVFDENAAEIYVNTLLRFLSFETYMWFKYYNLPTSTFERALKVLKEHFAKTEDIKLVGAGFDIKLYEFNSYLLSDTIFGFIAFLSVIWIIWAYSGSKIYMYSVGFCLIFSVGVAYFTYTIVFGIEFFPFMNLLVLVLLVGIGADDTFVLLYIFEKARTQELEFRKNANKPSQPQKSEENQVDDGITEDVVKEALSHAALSMFVTSATTAAAFFANVVNNIVTIRCFGLFAGTTMLVNYVLVVTWLPACLILYDRYFVPFWDRCCPRWSAKDCLCWSKSPFKPFYEFVHKLVTHWMPLVANKLRYVIVCVFTAIIAASIVIATYKPGMKLPHRNPIQIFKWNHPYEWYDNNAEEYFTFASLKYQWPLFATIVWGVLPRTDASLYNPNKRGHLMVDSNFTLNTLDRVNHTIWLMKKIRESPFVDQAYHHKIFWLRAYQRCSFGHPKLKCFQGDWPPKECNISRQLLGETDGPLNLEPCIRDFARRFKPKDDGPIFDHAGKIVGYRMEVKSVHRYSPLYIKLKDFFIAMESQVAEALEVTRRETNDVIAHAWPVSGSIQPGDSENSPETQYPGILSLKNTVREDFQQLRSYFLEICSLRGLIDIVTFGQSYATLWFDLLVNVRQGTPVSVACSVVVALAVVILSSRTCVTSFMAVITIIGIIATTIASIALLEWRLNIVEATIIILTVGLSFDFTLHYAVAYKLAPGGKRANKVQHAFGMIGIPVLLSTITTVAAGIAMCPSNTLAFYQIGVFMCLVTVYSYIYSSIFFMSLLCCFGPEESEWLYTKLCCEDDGPEGPAADDEIYCRNLTWLNNNNSANANGSGSANGAANTNGSRDDDANNHQTTTIMSNGFDHGGQNGGISNPATNNNNNFDEAPAYLTDRTATNSSRSTAATGTKDDEVVVVGF